MRNTFAENMTQIASLRKDVCLLSGDIGNRMFDDFKKISPERFINCGIAEANMMSIASGMALSGMRPVVYTITPFTTTRCLEQIRIGVAYHKAPVVIVGTGSGLSYSELGPTHHSLEDMAILRTIPGLNVLAPADSKELTAQLKEALIDSNPTYLRIGKKGEPNLHDEYSNLGIGKANMLKDGEDVVVIGVGPILGEALLAAKTLEVDNISVAVASLGGIKPIDQKFIGELSKRFKLWISIEEHGLIGGVSSLLSEWLVANRCNQIRLKGIGVPDEFIHRLGSQDYIRERYGMNSEGIIETIRTELTQ